MLPCTGTILIKEANVMIEVFDDRVDISSPVGLEEKDFGTKSMLRNPTLANLLHRMNYIEKMGTGVQSDTDEHGRGRVTACII